MKRILFLFVFISFSSVFASGELTITNSPECESSGVCNYNYALPSWFSINTSYPNDYDIIINVKDPDDNWHGYWETLTQCLNDGKCTAVSGGSVAFSYTHPESGSVYVNIQVEDTWYNDWTAAYMYHDVEINPYSGVNSISDQTLCDNSGLCGIKFSKDFIDELKENGTSTKDIKLNISFGNKGYFRESLNYCIVNRYCVEDTEGNLIFLKYYMLNSADGPIKTDVIHPDLGTIHLEDLASDYQPNLPDQSYKLKFSPQSYTEDGELKHIGPLFLMNNILLLAERDSRSFFDMRTEGFEMDILPGIWFIFADVPVGYSIKDTGWVGDGAAITSVVTQNELKAILPDQIKDYVENFLNLSESEKNFVNISIDYCVSNDPAVNFYDCLIGFLPIAQQKGIPIDEASIRMMRNYEPSKFFAIYKVEVEDNGIGSTHTAELGYESMMPEIFTNASDDTLWGKSEYDLFKNILPQIAVSTIKLCADIGDDGSDDDVFIQFNDTLDGGHTQIAYLDTAKDDWSSNRKECFFINPEVVGVEKVEDIHYLKLAKYPFDISTGEPKTNPGNDMLEIDHLELYVNEEIIYESSANMNYLISDINDDPEANGPQYYMSFDDNAREMFPENFRNYKTKSNETYSVDGEVINIYKSVTPDSFISMDYIKQTIEGVVGSISQTDEAFYDDIPVVGNVHFTMETGEDDVELEYVSEDYYKVKFGLTHKREYLPDLDIYVNADLKIYHVPDDGVVFHQVKLGNFSVTGDRTITNIQNVFRTLLVWANISSLGFALYSEDFWEWNEMAFDDIVGSIDMEEQKLIDGVSEKIMENVSFSEEGMTIVYTDRVRAYQKSLNLLFTCMDKEFYGNAACLGEYPKIVDALKEFLD